MITPNMTDEQKAKVLEYELTTAKHEVRNAEIRWKEMTAQYWELKPKYDELLNQLAHSKGLNKTLTTENKKLQDELDDAAKQSAKYKELYERFEALLSDYKELKADYKELVGKLESTLDKL